MSLRVIFFLFFSCFFCRSYGQKKEKASNIDIVYGADFVRNEEKYPGATVFLSDAKQVHFRHEGVDVWCDLAIYYQKKNTIKASGHINLKQGDTIDMTSQYVEYDGNTKMAIARRNVILKTRTSKLVTHFLYFNRTSQEAFYEREGSVIDSANIVTSKRGRFYLENNKVRFKDKVKVTNKDFIINSKYLFYYPDTRNTYFYGPTIIEGDSIISYCERGVYQTKLKKGFLLRNAYINYGGRIVFGDSIYFNEKNGFSSVTNNIKINDTANNAFVRGHYAELYKNEDKVIVTKRAVGIHLHDKDSLFIHGDTLMLSGKEKNRVMQVFHDVRIFQEGMSGKCDSIHSWESKGILRMYKKPVVWAEENQITGKLMQLEANVEEDFDSIVLAADKKMKYLNFIGPIPLEIDKKLKKSYIIKPIPFDIDENPKQLNIVDSNQSDESRKLKQLDKFDFTESEDDNIKPLDTINAPSETDKGKRQLDSIKVLGNAFVISQDTISKMGYNQMKGKDLKGKFIENDLREIRMVKNAEVLWYLYNEQDKLVGIDKAVSDQIQILIENKKIDEITFLGNPSGDIFPEFELPENSRKLKGFEWRGDEKIDVKDSIFSKSDLAIELPIIKGVDSLDIDKREIILYKELIQQRIEDSINMLKKDSLSLKDSLAGKSLDSLRTLKLADSLKLKVTEVLNKDTIIKKKKRKKSRFFLRKKIEKQRKDSITKYLDSIKKDSIKRSVNMTVKKEIDTLQIDSLIVDSLKKTQLERKQDSIIKKLKDSLSQEKPLEKLLEATEKQSDTVDISSTVDEFKQFRKDSLPKSND